MRFGLFMKSIGYRIPCRFCRMFFLICIHCFTGQHYCCSDCRIPGTAASRKKSRKNYAESLKGRINQCIRNRRYLLKKAAQKINVTDTTMQTFPNVLFEPLTEDTAQPMDLNKGNFSTKDLDSAVEGQTLVCRWCLSVFRFIKERGS